MTSFPWPIMILAMAFSVSVGAFLTMVVLFALGTETVPLIIALAGFVLSTLLAIVCAVMAKIWGDDTVSTARQVM